MNPPNSPPDPDPFDALRPRLFSVAYRMLGTRADAGRRLPERIVYRHTLINGEPGLLRYIDGNLEAAMALATDGERIVGIYTVRNPDKLAHIAQRLAPQKAVTNVGDATS